MGSFGSKTQPEQRPIIDIDDLQNRIRSLERDTQRGNVERRLRALETQADLNNDGIVTRDEMETYMATQLKMREDELIRLNHEKDELKKQYDELYKKHEEMLNEIREGRGELIPVSTVSNIAVEKFVEQLLADPNVNVYGLPDAVESAVYRNTIRLMLGAMEKVFENVQIEFIGHKINIVMQPLHEEK